MVSGPGGFVPEVHEAALQAASVHLSEGGLRAATFQQGFAGQIGETHLNQGLKLGACSDALIATTDFFLLLLFCVSGERP